jgi:hypothetical protein
MRDGGEQRGRGRGGQSKGRESRATEGRAEQKRGRREGRGGEGRSGGVEVMMWQRQKELRVAKDPICKYSHEGEILGSRFDLGLKSGPRL